MICAAAGALAGVWPACQGACISGNFRFVVGADQPRGHIGKHITLGEATCSVCVCVQLHVHGRGGRAEQGPEERQAAPGLV